MMSILAEFMRSIGVISIICMGVLCFGVVSAVMVSSPDVVKPGQQVSVFIGNLDENKPVSILITGNVKTDAGSPFSFGIHDLQLGLDITNPQVHVQMKGLVPASTVNLSVNHLEGVEIVYPPERVDANGACDFTKTESALPKGTYFIDINGTAARTQIPVSFEVSGINGNKETLAESSFNIVGISSGVFHVTTTVSGNVIEKKQFTVQDQLIALP
ncbi:hypothetical protein [Methanospirillum sp.]|uniref:hypothetical protein n=1 Tax=Methanospirillum sp. TaxID=45200 RepID=UPI002BA5301E|nr:hypothetical protein [Methanospirillum sp.]HPP77510.1 hypothetical protein [Methanospirillum sp.]